MALDDTIAILEAAPLLGLLDRDALRLLAFSAETRKLKAGETLFRSGERSDGGYVVLSGEITVGREVGTAILAGPSSVIGQTALFTRMQRPATAIARDASLVMRISPTLMRRVLQEFPAAAAALRDHLAEDLDELTGELDQIRAAFLEADEEPEPGAS